MRKIKVSKINLICSHCKKEFQKWPSQVKLNKNTVFCGNQCVIDYRKIHWKGKTDSICKTCGKEFKFNRAELKKTKGAGSFCSKDCQANGHEFKNCLTCNKEFKVYKSNIARGFGKYCSKSCAGKILYKNKECFQNLSPQERFFKSISKDIHLNECWIWTGLLNNSGYGKITINKKTIITHRYSYELYFGFIPEGFFVCHTCDNRSCCNPKHLFLGTHKENMQDMVNKNRSSKPKGSLHPNAKLNELKILEIRKLLNDKVKISEIAKNFNVCYETILHIKNKKLWSHVI